LDGLKGLTKRARSEFREDHDNRDFFVRALVSVQSLFYCYWCLFGGFYLWLCQKNFLV